MHEALTIQDLNARNGMIFLATVLNKTALDELEGLGINLRSKDKEDSLDFTTHRDPIETALQNIRFVELLKAAQATGAGNI
jgi:hypothetical protein